MFLIILCREDLLSATILTIKNMLSVILVFRFDRTAVIAHFHGEDERMVEQFVHLNSSTTILGEELIGVSAVHLTGREVAPIISKTFTLQRKQFGKKLRLCLFLYLRVAVAINERSFIRVRVRMQIHKKYYSRGIAGRYCLNGKDRRLFVGLGSIIEPVEIMAKGVHSVSPMKYSVRVH